MAKGGVLEFRVVCPPANTARPGDLKAPDHERAASRANNANEGQMAHHNQAEFESWHNAMMGTPIKRPAKTPNSKRSSGRATTGDRFIPNRAAMDISVSNFELTRDRENPENADVNASPAKEEYKKELAANLFAGSSTNKVLAFSLVTPTVGVTLGLRRSCSPSQP